MTGNLTAHQALYGYEDGHRLLVASTQLTSEDRRWLLRQTDSPDVGSGDTWGELLAGYPLPSGRYAWAMTWPALEMPRPGCVWTHVLILEGADLGSAAALPLSTFARPEGPEPDQAAYRRPVTLPASTYREPKGRSRDLGPALAAMLWAFYEPPCLPVRIGRVHLPDPARHELLVLPWQLAWPELRQRLSVTDAPVTPRRLPDGPYDLQLQSSARRRASEEERVIDGVPAATPPGWVETLTSEALAPQGLADFLAAVGPLLSAERDSMVPLVRCWRALRIGAKEPDEGAVRLLDALAAAVPRSVDPVALSQALLNHKTAPAGCAKPLDDVALLRALLAGSPPKGLDPSVLDVSGRSERVLRTRPGELNRVIHAVGNRPNAYAEEFLESVTGRLHDKSLKQWLSRDPSAMVKLLRLRPLLASDPDVWRALGPDEAWQALKRVRGKNQRVDVIATMVGSGLEIDPLRVAESWKGSGPAVTERLIGDGIVDERLGPWLETLTATQKKDLARRPDQQEPVVEAIMAHVEPGQLTDWGTPFLLKVTAWSTDPVVQAKIFLAAMASTTKPTWAKLGVAAYERLHQTSVIDDGARLGAARDLLSPVARDAAAERDVAKRLAKATSRALKHERWPPTVALGCKDERAFMALISSDDRAGLARRILEAAFDAPTDMEPWQRSALFATTTEKADRDALASLFGRVEDALSAAWQAVRPW